MSRMYVLERSEAQAVMDEMHQALERRLACSSLEPCPVEFTRAVVSMCATQSCGKCTPCRVGLKVLEGLLDDVLEYRATEETLKLIESTARAIYNSSDCAIGYEAGEMALLAVKGFHDDFVHHIVHQSCDFTRRRHVPCVSGCPAHVDIPGYISLVSAGRYTDAVRLIRKDNPLPLVCGLICEHPCEERCRRGMVDDALNIRGLKRYAVDHMDSDYEPIMLDPTGKRVAVIGGGPAGLSAAYFLTLMGHKCTVFESRHHLGGMLRYGIPAYRLPREELDREINWLVSCGIEVKLDTYVTDIEKLRKDYDAVYIAIGAHKDRKLNLPGEDAEGVISAVAMLRAMGDDTPPDFKGKSVCVVGGGNVAMDVARTSVRLGAKKVTIVYRRRVADMTAQVEEIEGARAEGCEILELHSPKEIMVEDGHVVGLKVEPQIIGGPRGGRPAPRKADADDVVLDCDIVAVAIGQAIDSKPFEDLGVPCQRGRIVANPDGMVPGFDNVWSGGDCQTGPSTVIRAIAAGKVAAGNIDGYFGYDNKNKIKVPFELPQVQFRGKISCARCELKEREAGERKGDFELMEIGYTRQEAEQEANRCLCCDHFGYGAFRGGRVYAW
ncbi:MAG: NAD(P)-binding protein [Atopobiaceae bacterium]|jgi:NADPH-dependent glutamate synthase beta subunit-like oxidoreductase